ncbi:F5/8 type C domain-containing protein [Duganella sp. CF517]|uniref:discoidin domain-containing protein n=1 Tax=Duganella sp. CF517 TaxID=1881038 RepID=UPI0008D3175C|nr:discoidin domain-containing protein [Duganella sp. CF517]SEN28998.1 F5/8 type C domain-containing protein [Duganella sp. CF517]
MKLMRMLAAGLVAALMAKAIAAEPQRVLDDFSSVGAWQAQASDGVVSAASAADGGLRLDFDFAGKGGYAFVRRALPLDLPENYEISFYVRADAPTNHFEFKMTDASGDNVWWFPQQNFSFPKQWQLVRIKKRQVLFAWGPTKDRVLKHADRIEFVVSAGSGGGKGSVYVKHLTIRALPPVPDTWPKPVAQATSHLAGGAAALAVDGDAGTTWVGRKSKNEPQRLTIDLGAQREFGGLVLHWQGRRYASSYDIELSSDGVQWRTARRVVTGNGGEDPLRLAESEARYIRLVMRDGPSSAYALQEVDLKDLAWGATPNQFIEGVAGGARRGLYPRGFSGQQSYWTLVGVDGGGDHSALISEDGALESKQGGFSVEPFVRDGNRLVTWADVKVSQSLRDGYLPVPSVLWRHPDWTLSVTAAADGTPASSQLLAKYELKNLGATARRMQLVLAVRPFQVNAPRQFLNTPGGFSAIHDLRWDGKAIIVNGDSRIHPLQAPAGVALSSFDGGLLPGAHPASVGGRSLHDETGMASAAMTYDVVLPPHGSVVIGAVLPMAGGSEAFAIPPASRNAAAWMAQRQEAVAAQWRDKLNRVTLKVPAAGRQMADTLRSSLAHMLMTREGASLQPGTRSYRRSWIRDGAMMSEALLRLGQPDIAAEYLRWYAPYQFDNGKVPCCVDRRGADPVPENDSHGQLIFLAAELYRYTRDTAALADAWPRVDAAARYMETLRQSERIEANRAPERRAFYGLMPASISHEGYSEKPMHSYWDDFWAMRGYKDAVHVAAALGKAGDERRLAAARDEFRHDLYASLNAATEVHNIDYLPGAAELGDFDPTSSTIALTPGGEQQFLPPAMLKATYDKYWDFFLARRDGRKAWEDYTPYELRNVSAFVRLGWRERAAQLLEYFYADQRPAKWNQWAEVVGRDMRQPRFVGDMPHGWISSDYIRAALDSFAYEREEDQALLLAEGVPVDWLRGEGIGLHGLRTPYGPLSYKLAAANGALSLHVETMQHNPPGGVVFTWPWDSAPGAATLNGEPVTWQNRQIRIDRLPAVLKINGAPL